MNLENSKAVLSESECMILRGFAILGIVGHNYCHWLSGVVQENEFQWAAVNVQTLKTTLISGGTDLLFNLLSFFGHYGVTIFLFLSAYGLEQKYGSGAYPTDRFIWVHFQKLFKMMFPGFIVSLALTCWGIGVPHRYSIVEMVAMLCLISNFLPDPAAAIFPGPYWFFGLMLQLYVIYRLLVYRRSLLCTIILIIVCVSCQLVLNPDGEAIKWYRYNFMGNMLPFGFGFIFARLQWAKLKFLMSNRRVLFVGCVVAATLAAFSCCDSRTWTITPTFVCVLSIFFVKFLLKIKYGGQIIGRLLGWFGGISVALFVWHPIVRSIFIRQDIGRGMSFVLYLCVCIIIARLMTQYVDSSKKGQTY